MENYFNELNTVNVSDHVEKKGNFSYLSWAYAVAELKKRHPDATWQVVRFDGLPYQKTELGYMVEVAVTVNGITHSQIHPVLDGRNKPLASPTVFDINTSIQRALVKAIALHGLGLYIYAGEDLPDSATPARITPDPVNHIKVNEARKFFVEKMEEDDIEANWEVVQRAYKKLNSNEVMELDTLLQDKANESKRAYKNILKDYLSYVPTEQSMKAGA